MKIVLSTLNAKYIHTSLALRLLYVANKDRFDVSFREFTIKEDIEKIAEELLLSCPDLIGLGVYIWNVKQTLQLVNILKNRKPEVKIVLGGPEVTYEPEYFIANWPVDFIISGEGEFVLGELIEALQKNKPTTIDGVSSKAFISKTVVQADLNQIATLPSPYLLEADKEELKNKLVYFETSRGCPYQCQYCLSSLEKGVRYFPKEYILSNLKQLIGNGAKLIKFLDRTFNLNKEHTSTIFDFLIENYRLNLSCQFEIYADLLTDDIIEQLNNRLPEKYFRFEIGIQSTYEPTNCAVKRKQNFPLLASNIRKLMDGGKIDLHLDLIAGLPYETFDRFTKSFNDVFELKGKEVQLGFLKMLRGTNLRKDAGKYGYKFNSEAPYEIEYNTDISNTELKRIHDAEHALEKYWNSGKFSRSMKHLFDNEYRGMYFELFDQIGQYYNQHNLPHHGYQLEDVFRNLHNFLLTKGIDIFEILRSDYYHNFKKRPHGFWENQLEKKVRKRLLYEIGQHKEFLGKYGLNRKIIEKYTAIDPISDHRYLLTIFYENNINTIIFDEII